MTNEEFQAEVLRRLDAIEGRVKEAEDAASCAYSSASSAQSDVSTMLPEVREIHGWVSWLCEQFEDETDDDPDAG